MDSQEQMLALLNQEPIGEPVTTTEPVVETPVVTEPVLEVTTPVVEPTEPVVVASTEVVEGKTEVKPSVFDLLKEDVVEEKPNTTELSAEIQAKLNLAAEYESLLNSGENNPFLKLLKMNGKPEDLVALAKELVPEDYSQKPIEELVKLDFANRLKFEGADLQEAIEGKLSELEDMPKYKRAEFEQELRSRFKPTQKESDFLKNYEAQYNNLLSSQPKPITQEEINTLVNTDKAEILSFAKNLIGANIEEGLVISEAHINSMVEKYDINEADVKYIGKDGKLNVKKFVNDKLLYSPEIVEARINASYEKGRKEALKEAGGIRKDAQGNVLKQVETPNNPVKAAIGELLGINIA